MSGWPNSSRSPVAISRTSSSTPRFSRLPMGASSAWRMCCAVPGVNLRRSANCGTTSSLSTTQVGCSMFASRAVQKHTQDQTPSRAKQMSQGQTPGLGQTENVPESSPPLQRYLGNSYVQAMTATGGETLQAPAVSPVVPSVPLRPSQSGILQRKCACGGAAGMSGECEECSKQTALGSANQTQG